MTEPGTTQTLPEKTDEPPPDVIDTSKMSTGQRKALEITEAARESGHREVSFVADLFMGRWTPRKLYPYREPDQSERETGDAFLGKLSKFLKENVDPDEIDQTGEISQEILDGLAGLGAFGIKVGRQYGGLGLSQWTYCKASTLIGSYCSNLFAMLSVHQSVGVSQPLILFGTEEQKQKFLPRVAKGEISAFALTEDKVGSDPGRMETRAEPTEDGQHFILNGEKLWCSNGLKAGVIVVTAKTPPKMVKGRQRDQITAFLLDMDTPGIENIHRCHFMGLRALYNGVIRFTDVKVPRENIIEAEGKGLKVALTTLNSGRLSIPAACAGVSKRCLQIAREWSNDRVQWGASIGKHAAIADKIRHIAANIFAMESMVGVTARMVDRDKKADIRLEAAITKLWGTEKTWEIADSTMQIRGGRGYETVQSLKNRGETPYPVERIMRDSRINTVFEGSSEIMRLFIMREALDPHLKVAGAVLNTQLPWSTRIKAAFKSSLFYVRWYPKQWSPFGGEIPEGMSPQLGRQFQYVARTSRRLSRTLFHQMVRVGPALEKKQVLLARIADIGTDLFAISASCVRAQQMLDDKVGDGTVCQLVDDFCAETRLRIEEAFRGIKQNTDDRGYRLTQEVLGGNYQWLENGIVEIQYNNPESVEEPTN